MRIFLAIMMCLFIPLAIHADDPTHRLSPKLQRALEVDSVVSDLQGIVVLCANACEPKSSSSSKMPTREKGSGMASGKRQHKPMTITKATSAARHSTAKAAINNVRALSCTGASACVDLIARKKMCKARTVKCTSAGCSCKKK